MAGNIDVGNFLFKEAIRSLWRRRNADDITIYAHEVGYPKIPRATFAQISKPPSFSYKSSAGGPTRGPDISFEVKKEGGFRGVITRETRRGLEVLEV